MRTVTFSDRAVKRRLDRDFRLAWINLEGDETAGSSFAHAPGDPAGSCVRGAGDHNVQILFTTPAGELLDAVAGFLGPEDLLAELDFVTELAEKTAAIESRGARRRMVEFAHRKAATAERMKKDDDLFADLRRQRLLNDHEFCRRKALMDARDFEPSRMVGRSTSFFGSSQGGRPDRRIGAMPKGGREFDLEGMLRDVAGRKDLDLGGITRPPRRTGNDDGSGR